MDKNEKDMNLFDFLILCWEAIKRLLWRIIDILMRTVRLCLQYCWVIIICTLLGLGGGWLLSRPRFVKFKGETTIYVTEGMKQTAIDGIRMFFLTGDTTRFKRYNIPKETVYAVRDLRFYDIVDAKCDSTPDYTDTRYSTRVVDSTRCIMTDRFNISFYMRGKDDFFPYLYALSAYLHHQPDIERADKLFKKTANQRLNFLNREIARIDSLAKHEYFDRPNYEKALAANGIIMMQENRQEPYTQQLKTLVRERNYVREQIDLTPEIINYRTPFLVTRIPTILYYKYGLAIGAIIGLLMALVVKYRKQIFAYLIRKN